MCRSYINAIGRGMPLTAMESIRMRLNGLNENNTKEHEGCFTEPILWGFLFYNPGRSI